jgi:hypothetical protein
MKEKIINLVIDNGLSVTLAVSFCVGIYYIMDKHQSNSNRLFIEAIKHNRLQQDELFDELLDCLKDRNNG